MVQSSRVTITVSELVISLSIDVWPSSGKFGDVFTFTGTLMQDGTPMTGYSVNLMLEGITPELISSVTTDSGGVWSLDWYSDRSGSLTFYAEVFGLESKRIGIGISKMALGQWVFRIAPIATGILLIKVGK